MRTRRDRPGGEPRRRLLLAASGVVAVLLWAPVSSMGAGATEPGAVWLPVVARHVADRPADARQHRLVPAPRVPEHGTFALLRPQQPGEDVVTWDPCVPIHVEVNVRTGGHDAVVLVEEALDSLQQATGLEFVLDGLTARTPRLDGEVRRDELGHPVLVAWSDPDEVPELAGVTAGLGGSVAVGTDGAERYVTGQVALDGPAMARMDAAGRTAIILHELGHVVGLGHVDDQRELMFAQDTGATRWGPGDLRGLAVLGSGACN